MGSTSSSFELRPTSEGLAQPATSHPQRVREGEDCYNALGTRRRTSHFQRRGRKQAFFVEAPRHIVCDPLKHLWSWPWRTEGATDGTPARRHLTARTADVARPDTQIPPPPPTSAPSPCGARPVRILSSQPRNAFAAASPAPRDERQRNPPHQPPRPRKHPRGTAINPATRPGACEGIGQRKRTPPIVWWNIVRGARNLRNPKLSSAAPAMLPATAFDAAS